MKIYKEENLSAFEFWGGAVDTANMLTEDEFCEVEASLESLYPDGMDETQLNDIFWFDPEFIVECLGYSSWEEFEETKRESDD